MGTSFEDILNRMRNAPHNGIPPVTNPNVPSKVERDAAAFEARPKEMPKFHFGAGTQLEQLVNHMKTTPHPTPKYADPNFRNSEIFKDSTLTKSEREAFELRYQAYAQKLKSDTTQRKQDSEKDNCIQDEIQAEV